jgi:hypothetical protein
MSTDGTTPDIRSQRIKEFLQILPLTIEIAGIPAGEPDRINTPDQMEVRANQLRTAYKFARQLLKEIGEGA